MQDAPMDSSCYIPYEQVKVFTKQGSDKVNARIKTIKAFYIETWTTELKFAWIQMSN